MNVISFTLNIPSFDFDICTELASRPLLSSAWEVAEGREARLSQPFLSLRALSQR